MGAGERGITALHEVVMELEACETPDEVYRILVEAAREVIDQDRAAIDLLEGASLESEAPSPPGGSDDTAQVAISQGETVATRAYRTDEPVLVDDLRTRSVTASEPAFRSALAVPIGEHGVLQAASPDPGAFDETDLELAQLLGGHARINLDHIRQRIALTQQNERLQEFAGIVSHDLRNPLEVAKIRVDVAQQECDSEHLEVTARALDRMEALISDVLTWAREGTEVDEVEAIRLSEAVEDCWEAVDMTDATLRLESDRTVEADASRLQQLLENLFRNAVEHAGPSVRITVGDLDDGFFVEDDGPGIPAVDREKVFEAGYSTRQQGTGFGLNIVRVIADGHGWDVSVTEGRDGGARFEFTGF